MASRARTASPRAREPWMDGARIRWPCSGKRFGRLLLQEREQRGDLVAHVAAIDDHVDRALLEQELGALEALGELLAHGLLDDPRAGEPDERFRLGDDDVPEEAEASRHP